MCAISLFFSCNSTLDEKITKENLPDLLESIRKNENKEVYDQVQGIVKIAAFAKLGGKEPIDLLKGKSFNEHIKHFKNKAKQAEAKKKADNLKKLQFAKEEEKRSEERSRYLEVITWSKKQVTDRYNINKKVQIGAKFKNKTSEDIDAFEGVIYIYDKLDNKLAELPVKNTSILKGNKENGLLWEFSTISYTNKMKEVFSSKATTLKFRFDITKLLLKNGKTL